MIAIPHQRLALLPGLYGRAHPSRGAPTQWVPDRGLVFRMDTTDAYWILCLETAIPGDVERVPDLQVLLLKPDGFLIKEVADDLKTALPPDASITMQVLCHFKSDVGLLVAKKDDMPTIVAALESRGHSVTTESLENEGSAEQADEADKA